jgi:hypothetical protein
VQAAQQPMRHGQETRLPSPAAWDPTIFLALVGQW